MKKIAFFVLLFVLLTTKSQAQAIFQIVKETRCLLFCGIPYPNSAADFWKIKGVGSCLMFCEDENILFVRDISLITKEPGVPYGAALLKRDKSNNRWLCALFIPREHIDSFGLVQKLSFADSAKTLVKVSFSNIERTYQRWDW